MNRQAGFEISVFDIYSDLAAVEREIFENHPKVKLNLLVELLFFRDQFELYLLLLHGLSDLELDEFVVDHLQDLVSHGVVRMVTAENEGPFADGVFFVFIIIFNSLVDQSCEVLFVA